MSRMVFYDAVQVFTDDALTALKAVPSSSAQACLTSPPFYLLRKYGASANWPDGWEGELGHEPHPNDFIRHLLLVLPAELFAGKSAVVIAVD